MLRAVLLVILAFVWLGSRLDAKAVPCLSTNPCKRPPCEFMYELKIAKAILRAQSQPFLESLDASSHEEIRRFNQQTRVEITKAYNKYAACPSSIFYRRPPTPFVSNTRQCQIEHAAPQPVTLEDMLAISNSCSENVEAEFASARQSQLICLAFQNEKEEITVSEFRHHRRAETEAAIKSMEQSLLRYLSSCKPGAKTSRELSELGLNALKKAGGKARREWKRAQRAAARRK
jgi:hypothetical protein